MPARMGASQPLLVVLPGGRNQATLVAVPRGALDEARIEASVARQGRIEHSTVVRRFVRSAMSALAQGHLAVVAMYLVELDQLNEQEAVRALAIDAPAAQCPKCTDRQAGHGRAA